MKFRTVCAWCAPLLLLAGCEDEAVETDTPATGGKAAGEVLGGTISDDMLALEELTSTSPPAERPAPERGSDGTAPAADEESGSDTQEAEASEDAPAPETAPDQTGEE